MSLWGELYCPICIYKYFNLSYFILPLTKIRSEKRIGPHNYDILSILFGSLLGDGFAERHGNGTRIAFYQENSHTDYLTWLHNLISGKGYCNGKIPILQSRLTKHGKLRNIIRFKTYTYTSFNWIHEAWYKDGKKVLPSNIEGYISPIALSIWIMDDGAKVSSGIKLATNNFSLPEVKILCAILNKKYNLNATPNRAGDFHKKEYVIYIHKSSMERLANIVSPFMHNSMKYKLNNYL